MSDLGNRTNVNAAIDLLLDDAQPNESIQPSDHNGLLKDILDTLANGLSVTLRTGNTTSGQNIEVTSGDAIDFDNSSFLGSLTSGTLTAARTYTLPDKTGTVAMLSDVENILNTNGLVLGGNYTHDLNSNNLGMFDGSIGLGDDLTVISNDGTKQWVANFIASSTNAVLSVQNINENVGIGDSAPDISAKLEINSTDKGLLIPRMTTTQRNAIGSPAESLMIYNTTDDQFEFYDSLGAWSQLGGGGASIYTADGTVSGNRVVNLNTNDLDFKDGDISATLTSFIGASNPQGKFFSIPFNREGYFDGSLWFRNLNNSTGAITPHHRFYSGGVTSYVGAGTTTNDKFSFGKTNNNSGAKFEMLAQYSGMFIHNNAPVTKTFLGLLHLYPDTGAGTVALNVENPVGSIIMARANTNREVIIRGTNVLASEKISLQGHTAVHGEGTTTGTTLALYDNDTIPTKNVDFLDNGQVRFLNLPTSSVGLSAGDIWNDGGTLKIV